MLRVEFMPGAHWVTDAEAQTLRELITDAVDEARGHLPGLPTEMYVLVHQNPNVNGDGGYAIGPQVIRWDVDPSLGLEAVARLSLRSTLLHEAHHAARLVSRPQDAALVDWRHSVVFEGLATVFQATVTGKPMPWQEYDEAVIAGWAAELFSQPIDQTAGHWRFQHPDGREAIVYRVGSWIVERAIQESGRSAADLVATSPEEILLLAQVC